MANGINGVLNSAIGYIWTTAANDDDRTSPPDYWFSFERSNRTKLGGILSKDVTQSYTKRSVRPAPQFALRNMNPDAPAYVSENLGDRTDRLEILAYASARGNVPAGQSFGGRPTDAVEGGIDTYPRDCLVFDHELKTIREQEDAVITA